MDQPSRSQMHRESSSILGLPPFNDLWSAVLSCVPLDRTGSSPTDESTRNSDEQSRLKARDLPGPPQLPQGHQVQESRRARSPQSQRLSSLPALIRQQSQRRSTPVSSNIHHHNQRDVIFSATRTLIQPHHDTPEIMTPDWIPALIASPTQTDSPSPAYGGTSLVPEDNPSTGNKSKMGIHNLLS
jgi:hypothetical protein